MDIGNRGDIWKLENYQGLLPTIANIASAGLQTYIDVDPNQRTFTQKTT